MKNMMFAFHIAPVVGLGALILIGAAPAHAEWVDQGMKRVRVVSTHNTVAQVGGGGDYVHTIATSFEPFGRMAEGVSSGEETIEFKNSWVWEGTETPTASFQVDGTGTLTGSLSPLPPQPPPDGSPVPADNTGSSSASSSISGGSAGSASYAAPPNYEKTLPLTGQARWTISHIVGDLKKAEALITMSASASARQPKIGGTVHTGDGSANYQFDNVIVPEP